MLTEWIELTIPLLNSQLSAQEYTLPSHSQVTRAGCHIDVSCTTYDGIISEGDMVEIPL